MSGALHTGGAGLRNKSVASGVSKEQDQAAARPERLTGRGSRIHRSETQVLLKRKGVIGAAIATVLGLYALLMPMHGLAQEVDSPDEDLRAAIKGFVERQGFTYAGLCREIDQAQFIGQYCGFVFVVDDTTMKVTYGLVLSDEIHEETFIFTGGRWVAESEAGEEPTPSTPETPGSETPQEPATPTPQPESPGEDGDSGNDWLILGGVAPGLIASGGLVAGIAGARRRR